MSIYQKASLVQIPSGYKSGTLYSVVPNNGDGNFTVTGDPEGEATRVNKDGLIESVAADVPRLNYDPTNPQDPHLLLEPTRTNFVSPNNSLTGYTTNGVSTTNNDAIAPNGTNEGAKVQATTSGTAVVFKGLSTTSSNATHNFSVFVKAGTHNILQIQEGFAGANIIVDLSDGTEVSSQNATNKKIEEYPNGWYRVSFNFTSNGTNLQFSIYFSGSYSSGDNYYVWGGQIEAGSYATSLIPTTTGAVTRTVDTCQLENFANMPTDYPFTVFWEGKIDEYESGGFTTQVIFSLVATGAFNCYFALNFSNTNTLIIRRRNSTDTSQSVAFSSNQNTIYKVAVCFISSTAIKVYINGSEVFNSTNLVSVPYVGTNTPDTVLIGQLRNTVDTGKRNSCDQFMLFNEALSDSELQTLTS